MRNSTMAFNKINTYPQTGMSQALPLYLKDNIQVISFAKNSPRPGSFIAEKRHHAIEKELKKGDYLFVQFGHNDSKADESASPDRIRILRKIFGCSQRQQRPAVQRPYLLPPLPDVCLMKTELLNREATVPIAGR